MDVTSLISLHAEYKVRPPPSHHFKLDRSQNELIISTIESLKELPLF
jgi:hypothetical protein